MDENGPIRLLICDDHRTLTDALSMVVERDPELDLVAPAVHDAERAVDLCRVHRPDVVLMDVEFKVGISGIEATRRIKQDNPTTKVVIMTAHDDERVLVETVEAGASGFLGKDEPADEVLAAAKAAAEGEVLIDPGMLARLLHQVTKEREQQREVRARFATLSEREWEILRHVAQGERNDDIARALFISPQTVQTHVRNVLGKLEVHSKLEAVALAVRHSQIDL
ncbi:MAG TPA: response regulator transcription factor [Actinomycetota bacterium]|nr:response regulator transcription factor [Actinomycetota bacterium]